MRHIKNTIKQQFVDALNSVVGRELGEGSSIDAETVIAETPPNPELGDIAFPMFPYAKVFKTAPPKIAEMVTFELQTQEESLFTVFTAGPYINIRLNRTEYSRSVIEQVLTDEEKYGKSDILAGSKVMIEFSSPNTNKPLHLGHMRNDAIGESTSRLFKACGAEVRKVNLINDRGIHICKSMLAYSRFGEGKTPESENIKSDHFVGDYYVKFNEWQVEHPQAEEEAQTVLVKWEQGDEETVELWKKMNDWALDGIYETYRSTNVSFDGIYRESDTYKLGKQEVLDGLDKGTFYKDDTGTVWVDLDEIKLDKKVLLRADGTSLYMTQDIGTVIQRHRDWPFERMIYVVGSEQEYHFQVLFHILQKLGYAWAANLFHLSYGMVNLTEGKMKSREGTVVDADDLIAQLSDLALQEIREKGREEAIRNPQETAAKIALGALHFYLLQPTPSKDMIFNPKESIAFTGNTGPYLQYTCSRISSMIKKYEERKEQYEGGSFCPELLTVPEEWQLIKLIGQFREKIEKSCLELNPSILTSYLYDLAKTFSQYYHDNPVLHNEDVNLVVSRISLARCVLLVIKSGLECINVPFLSSM